MFFLADVIKLYIYFPILFVFTFGICFAQQQSVGYLEHVITVFESDSSQVQLKNNYEIFSQSVPKNQQDNLSIVYAVFQAIIHANTSDSLNTSSSVLFSQANQKVLKTNNIALQAWVQTQAGFYYYRFFDYENALQYFLKSSRLLDEKSELITISRVDVLKKNAYFFLTTLEHQKSVDYLNLALKATQANSTDYATLLSAIGYCYFDMLKMDNALYYFKKAHKYALQNNDTIRYAKSLGDIGRVYIHQKKWNEGEELLKKDIEISMQQGDARNTMYAKLQLGLLYQKSNQLDKAKQVFIEAKQYASNKPYLKEYVVKISKLLLPIASEENNFKWELQLHRTIDSLNISLGKSDKDLPVDALSWRTLKEKIDWQLEAEKLQTEKENIIKWTFIGIVLLFIALCILVTLLYLSRSKKQYSVYQTKLSSFKLQKLNSEILFNSNKSTLDTFKDYLLEKNEQINVLTNEIENLSTNPSRINTKQKDKLEKLLDSYIMSVNDWKLFKEAFIAEEKIFYTSLIEQYPNISESNLRIIMLKKIGLSNAQIAKTISITIDGVKKAKQRMRKKNGPNFDTYL